MLIIRASADSDIPAIAAIYAHHVQHGTGTFELDPPTAAEMGTRRAEVIGRGLPYLVAEDGNDVVGFAYCNWFKPRPAYRFSAEDSIYLAPQVHTRGLGRALLAELCLQAQAAGIRKLIAVIGDSANAASIGVHSSVGFAQVGVLKSCGWKFGAWRDVVLMDKFLGAADGCPPEGSQP